MRERLTKSIATVTLLSVCGSAYGQADVWACQEIESSGLKWANGKWESVSFEPKNYLLRIDGANSSYQEDGETYPLVCEVSYVMARSTVYENCQGIVKETFLLNISNGLGSYMSALGGLFLETPRDSLVVSALQCTKF
jgi:hypothetical protein